LCGSSTDSAFGFLQTNNSTTLIGDVELISTSGGAHNPGGVIDVGLIYNIEGRELPAQ
jgi:hypothetical protein